MEEKPRPGEEERDVIVRVWDERGEHGVIATKAKSDRGGCALKSRGAWICTGEK